MKANPILGNAFGEHRLGFIHKPEKGRMDARERLSRASVAPLSRAAFLDGPPIGFEVQYQTSASRDR